MKYFDTFTGIGGFSVPLNELGHECVGFSEVDKYAQSVYLKHFPNHKPYGDITTINADELPDFDLLVGGFPCQAFSIAGKRRGFEDTRGTMFFELARILQAKQPRLFVFENVKGLLSHDSGRTFATIITTITELGYDCQWQVLNSKNHGVPQNRERVFIVGNIRGTRRPEVFSFGETSQQSVKELTNRAVQSERLYGTEGISPCLDSMQGGMKQPKIYAQRGRYNEDGTTSQQLEPRTDGLTNTLTSVQKDNLVNGIRRLTPIECERLQGFPDNWTKYGKDGELISGSQRYKMCGNAVTVNVVRFIISNLSL
jgi:DNA (cytosine-5)-methyltransferase 1